MKKLVLALCLAFSTAVFANPIDDKCGHTVVWGAPQIKTEGDNQYICKSGYGVNLNYKTKVAYFVTEHITPEGISVKAAARKDDFREDIEVPVQYRVTLKDYTGAGYDRGHISPAADHVADAKLMSESFFLSNMMPQAPAINRGAWRILEEKVRDAAKESEIFVITGTIYQDGYKTIGNGVGVPSSMYKIVVQPSTSRVIAFLIPNEGKIDPKELSKYTVSVADIESKTGIDFSPAIPADLKPLESVVGKLDEWN
jgi:endonuclease G